MSMTKATQRVWVALLMTSLLCLTQGCGEDKASVQSERAGDVVARVGGEPIYLQELLDSLQRLGLKPTATNLQNMLQKMLDRRASVARLQALGLDQSDAFLEKYRLLAQDTLKQHYESQHPANLRVTEQEIETYYQQHQAEFVQPEQIRLSAIALSPDLGAEAPTLSDTLWQELMAQAEGNDRDQLFKRYAAKYSAHRASRYRGGDAGWISRQQNGPAQNSQWPAALISEGFTLQPGQYRRLVTDNQQHFIFYISGYNAEYVKPLEDVADRIRRNLAETHRVAQQAAMQRFIQEGIDVQVDQQILTASAVEDGPAVASFPMPKLN
ncbi:MAG: peptidyl-prolyl cis-trans isomerase [Pseudomonadota bacterium]|nr:peptidyl-prolyl cis-trans isomerase [Pseudomonadota bacterium]